MNKLVVTAAAAVAISLGGGAIALASIPDGSGDITACYHAPVPAHGAPLNIIDTGAGGSCGGGMTAVTWSQTGPQGPAGPQGDAGPAGPSTMGPAGLDEFITAQYVTIPGPVVAGQSLHATAVCPADHPYIVTGGYPGAGLDRTVTGSFPLQQYDPTTGQELGTWNVYFIQNTDQPNDFSFKFYIVCAK